VPEQKLVSFFANKRRNYFSNSKVYFMNSKKKSAETDENNAGKNLLGKRHDEENKPYPGKTATKDSSQKDRHGTKNEDEKGNEVEKGMEITDNPEETEKKLPRMNH
jgi:hypothetical protein